MTETDFPSLQPSDLGRLIPPRSRESHKGDYGRILIFAGSPGMCGAAAYCAKAAIRSGAGLTTILCRASILPILQALVPAAMCVPLAEESGQLLPSAVDKAARRLAEADAAVFGCGLGQTMDLLPFARLFREASCPVIWDADGLNLLAANRDLLPLPPHHMVTPHPGEAARLLGCSVKAVQADRMHFLRSLHTVTGASVLLKGADTLMTDGQRTAVNSVGSPAMAKGGSGDILAGILAALAGQHICPDALSLLRLGTLIHGTAGLRAAASLGEYCVTPEELVQAIRMDDRFLPTES